jgi:hypothetical protein
MRTDPPRSKRWRETVGRGTKGASYAVRRLSKAHGARSIERGARSIGCACLSVGLGQDPGMPWSWVAALGLSARDYSSAATATAAGLTGGSYHASSRMLLRNLLCGSPALANRHCASREVVGLRCGSQGVLALPALWSAGAWWRRIASCWSGDLEWADGSKFSWAGGASTRKPAPRQGNRVSVRRRRSITERPGISRARRPSSPWPCSSRMVPRFKGRNSFICDSAGGRGRVSWLV